MIFLQSTEPTSTRAGCDPPSGPVSNPFLFLPHYLPSVIFTSSCFISFSPRGSRVMDCNSDFSSCAGGTCTVMVCSEQTHSQRVVLALFVVETRWRLMKIRTWSCDCPSSLSTQSVLFSWFLLPFPFQETRVGTVLHVWSEHTMSVSC